MIGRLMVLSMLLTGCATEPRDIGRPPPLSQVRTSMSAFTDSATTSASAPLILTREGGSLWTDNRSGLFRDPRASKIGDLLTVNISINDRAQLGNTTDRTRESRVRTSLDFAAELLGLANVGNGSYEVDAASTSKGEGSINRSEKIQLSVAAIVKNTLPNGNLLIEGSQEMRVNSELRSLEIAGIVRPGDIGRDNTISYDKIAEARVSYGGRGRITEVQQPALVHQLHDIFAPF